MLFALIGSLISFRFIVPWCCSYVDMSLGLPAGWVVFGLLMGCMGMIGDLAESLLKRDVGCKISSDWMPGFGGVLTFSIRSCSRPRSPGFAGRWGSWGGGGP